MNKSYGYEANPAFNKIHEDIVAKAFTFYGIHNGSCQCFKDCDCYKDKGKRTDFGIEYKVDGDKTYKHYKSWKTAINVYKQKNDLAVTKIKEN